MEEEEEDGREGGEDEEDEVSGELVDRAGDVDGDDIDTDPKSKPG